MRPRGRGLLPGAVVGCNSFGVALVGVSGVDVGVMASVADSVSAIIRGLMSLLDYYGGIPRAPRHLLARHLSLGAGGFFLR